MNLSNRLKTIATYIPEQSYVADIGCDHALLSIYLLMTKKNIRIYASDVNQGPLQMARENIRSYQMEKRIVLKQANGLENMDCEVDTVVIAGMGGKLIAQILQKHLDQYPTVLRLVLSPNNYSAEVRKACKKLDFHIVEEQIIQEKNKFYPILFLQRGEDKIGDEYLYYGKNIVKNQNLMNFIEYEMKKIDEQMKRIPLRYEKKRLELSEKLDALKKIIT